VPAVLTLSPERDQRLRRWLVWGYAAAALLTVFMPDYRSENNFLIYRFSTVHLLAGQNLYALYPAHHADVYLYSPTFAILFAPFTLLPTTSGILLWNLGSLLLLYHSVDRLIPDSPGSIALAGTLLGFLITQDGTETNLLVAAVMVYAMIALEGDRPLRAAGAIALGAVIKIFPLAALALGAFSGRKVRFALLFLSAVLALVLLPLLLVRPDVLLAQYGLWWGNVGQPSPSCISVMRRLREWLGVKWWDWPVQLAGIGVVLAPLVLQPGRWADRRFHRLYLASILMFVVLFNHQGEYNSYSIALTGAAIWCALPPLSPAKLFLALLAIASVRIEATLLAWVAIQADLWRSAGTGKGLRGTGPALPPTSYA
jgi:hypothetical protein